jgi:hypothetical protein
MRFLLSGEGPTDIGNWGYDETGDRSFHPGPMSLFVDILAEPQIGFSPLEVDAGRCDVVTFIDEGELNRRGRTDPLVLRGKKAGIGNAYFTKNAQVLGLIAKDISERDDNPVVAVLFRDGDGTQSQDDWSLKRESIRRGFERVEFPNGVPMVPHPKSEAWLLCALSKGYQSCESLESRSGNDASPHSLKAELERLLGEQATREVVNDYIRNGRIDPHRINMPSFNVFKERLAEALS